MLPPVLKPLKLSKIGNVGKRVAIGSRLGFLSAPFLTYVIGVHSHAAVLCSH